MVLAWDEYLSVGNALLDSGHKNLILLINRIELAIIRRDPAELSKAAAAFVTHMHIHLKDEEQVAEAVEFPLVHGRLECEQITYEIGRLTENLDSRDGVWPDNLVRKYSQFLNDWMMEHIIKQNMQMKPVLRNHPYDFKPG